VVRRIIAPDTKLKTKVNGHRVVVDQGTVTLGLLERLGKDFPRLRFYEGVGHTADQFSRIVLLDNGVERSQNPASSPRSIIRSQTSVASLIGGSLASLGGSTGSLLSDTEGAMQLLERAMREVAEDRKNR
jgi:hypothetical protein